MNWLSPFRFSNDENQERGITIMQILTAASAFPKYYYSQDVLCRALEEYWGDKLQRPALMRRLQRHTGVEGRYLSLPLHAYTKLASWGETNSLWIQTAIELGKQAVCRALSQAGLAPRDLSALFFTSVTGISSPSIDALLINRMGLSPNIRRIPMFGLGCVAGAAGIAWAADYVKAHPSQLAVLLSVELCSLTLQREDLSVANLISAGLFGDGAAAVIVAGEECDLPVSDVTSSDLKLAGPRILATRSVFYPQTEDMMGWAISEKGFRIVLSREVPKLVRQRLGGDVDAFLAEMGYARSDIGSWVLHTGGPKVLEATQAALGLEDGQLDASWDCLRKTGNLSSASVLVVLEEVMKRRRPEPSSLGLLAAMGPGFCSELVLLRW
jgi:alkylresorcinol/alkylpyrone synthase